MDVGKMQERPINFVSFTPGTSFDVGNSSGWSRERELMYWMLHDAWGFTFKKTTRLLHANAGLEGFQKRVRAFPRETIHPGIAGRFREQLEKQEDLRSRFDEIGDALTGDQEAARGWSRHVQLAREIVDGSATLGRPPEDLARTLADFAVAAPGVVALRTLGRVIAEDCGQATVDLRSHAASLAHAFLHLFNLPEVMALLRDRHGEVPYWRSVLAYCAAGNLQAVLDEYAHVLIELLGLVGKEPPKVAAELCKEIQRCLTLRTATAQAEVIVAAKRRVRRDDTLRLRTRFAMRFGDQDAEDSSEPTRADQVRAAFNSPFWPFVLATTSVGQEGLDFHPYCHAVVHWNVPTNPVDLEQREGRVHRYKGHALRRNVAARYGDAVGTGDGDPWAAMFDAARQSRPADQNDLFPFWITPDGIARIERHVPALPYSREIDQQANVRRSLVLYRMVFGQNRQEDLVDYLLKRLPEDSIKQVVELCRVDLSPPRRPDQEST